MNGPSPSKISKTSLCQLDYYLNNMSERNLKRRKLKKKTMRRIVLFDAGQIQNLTEVFVRFGNFNQFDYTIYNINNFS